LEEPGWGTNGRTTIRDRGRMFYAKLDGEF
jgi:hypothetical protein